MTLKRFMFIPSVVLAFWMLKKLHEPFGIYEAVWVVVLAFVLGGILGFFAYLFFVAYIKKPLDR